jgi:hypothetical protein
MEVLIFHGSFALPPIRGPPFVCGVFCFVVFFVCFVVFC